MSQNIGSELPPLSMEKTEIPSQVPTPEVTSNVERTENQMAKAIETAQPTPPSTPPPAQSNSDVNQHTAQSQPSGNDPASPMIADDADLIEKEWVLRAKEIVERTRQDPYRQNKEVEKMKADYMKKRYNKEIKLTED